MIENEKKHETCHLLKEEETWEEVRRSDNKEKNNKHGPSLEELAMRPPVGAVDGAVVVERQFLSVIPQFVLLVPHRHQRITAIVE